MQGQGKPGVGGGGDGETRGRVGSRGKGMDLMQKPVGTSGRYRKPSAFSQTLSNK